MVDHLVYATPDLAGTLDKLARTLGVDPTPGGPHPGFGTRNSLISLGGRSYLEVIGPDPEQPTPDRARPFGIDDLAAEQLVTWAIAVDDLDATLATARAAGWDPGNVIPLSRALPDGTVLAWRVAMRPDIADHAVIPFLIDWGDLPAEQHPSVTAVSGVTVTDFHAEHPDPTSLAAALECLGVRLECTTGEVPGLVASLSTPNGDVTLR